MYINDNKGVVFMDNTSSNDSYPKVSKIKALMLDIKYIPKIIIGLILVNFTISLAKFMTYPFLAVYLKNSLSLSATEVGLLLGISPLSSMIFSIMGGRVADVYGIRKIYPIAVIIPSICLTAYGLVHNYFILCSISIVLGIAWSVYNSSNQSLLSLYSPEDKLSKIFSYNYWVFNLSGVIGPIIGIRFINSAHSPLALFLFSGVLLIVGIIVTILFAKKTKEDLSIKKEKTTEKLINRKLFNILISDKALILLSIAYFSIFFIESQMDTNIVQHLQKSVTNGLILFSQMLSLSMTIIIIFQPIAAHFIDKIGTKKILVLGSCLYGLGPFFFMVSTTHFFWYFGMVVMTFGEIIISPKIQSLIAKIPKEGYRTTYYSVVNMGGNSAFFLGPFIGGIIYDNFGINTLFLLLMIIAVIFGIAMIMSHKYIIKKEQNDAKEESLTSHL